MGDESNPGWKLPKAERDRLLQLFPPAYGDIVADHVTAAANGNALPPQEREGEVIGIADDHEGVQALVVAIGGSSDRPDGSVYHITWSLDREAGRKPVQSNDVIREHGWRSVEPVPITLEPAAEVS